MNFNSHNQLVMENQYEKQFERRDRSEQAERNFKKYYYNEETLNYRCIRPAEELNVTPTNHQQNNSCINNDNVLSSSDDEDTIKSVYSDTRSIRTEDFSNVFNKYVALTNKNLEMHDKYLLVTNKLYIILP